MNLWLVWFVFFFSLCCAFSDLIAGVEFGRVKEESPAEAELPRCCLNAVRGVGSAGGE